MELSQNDCRLAVGIDIGTTTIGFSVIDNNEKQLKAYTYQNPGRNSVNISQSEQDPEKIVSLIIETVDCILSDYPCISSIGITGQMHGILYIDTAGNSVSPLYTWQDNRAENIANSSGESYCDIIKRLTGYQIASGYGLATHYFNLINQKIPSSAVKLCTIMDYAVMKLTGITKPLIHASNAASLGIYNIKHCCFDATALDVLGILEKNLPEVTFENYIVGKYREIPVAVAIGDNQASFLGSVKDEKNSILVNFGTGSQISFVADSANTPLELRPYINGKFLSNGSALCGGKAYALLENFFRIYAEACGAEPKPQYEIINLLAEKEYEKHHLSDLKADTRFCGTREIPYLRGSITSISENNFTPGALAVAILRGMAEELKALYSGSSQKSKAIKLIASGNAVRKNPVFQKILSDVFEMELSFPAVVEEAAFGAALFSLYASHKNNSI